MRFKRSRFSSQGISDISPQAGWVFADLLLALSIIFLTSISFDTPGKSGEITSTELSSSALAEIDFTDLPKLKTKTLTLEFNEFNQEKILAGIQEFQSKDLSPRNTYIVYAQLIGGFDSKLEGSEEGSLRAAKFLIELKKSRMTEFDSAGFDISTSSLIKPGFVVMRIAFAEN